MAVTTISLIAIILIFSEGETCMCQTRLEISTENK